MSIVGEVVTVREAFKQVSSLKGLVEDQDGNVLTLHVKGIGRVQWSPEDGGYIAGTETEQAAGLLASRGILVPAQYAEVEGTDIQSIALEILIEMYNDLIAGGR